MRIFSVIKFKYHSIPFILALLVMAVLFAFDFNPHLIPLHDTFAPYMGFHNLYSDFFNFHQPTLWYPYVGFGIPAAADQLMTLSMSQYMVGFFGLIFHIKNTLFLFKLSIIFNILFYLFGVYLCASICFKNNLSKLIVLISAGMSVSWLYQLELNFTILYLMPLIFYCQIMFIRKKDLRWIFLSAFIFLLNAIGNVPYFLVMQFYVDLFFIFPIFLAEVLKNKKLMIWERTPWKGFMLVVLFGIIIFTIFLISFKNGIICHSPQRNQDYSVSRNTFLHFCVNTMSQSLYGHLTGLLAPLDNSFYCGIVPLLMFLLGTFFVRNIIFVGFVSAILFMIALSQAGWIAGLAYYLPGMSFYRHLGYLWNTIDSIVILASGFFIDKIISFASNIQVINIKEREKIHGKIYLLVFSIIIGLDFYFTWRSSEWFTMENIKPFPFLFKIFICFFCIGYFLIANGIKKDSRYHKYIASVLLTFAVIFDFGIYQSVAIHATTFLHDKEALNLFKVKPFRPQTNRVEPMIMKGDSNSEFFYKTYYSTMDAKMHGGLFSQRVTPFIGIDYCYPYQRLDFMNVFAYQALVNYKANPNLEFPGPSFKGEMSQDYLTYIGCESSKWRFYSNYLPRSEVESFSEINPLVTLVLQNKGNIKAKNILRQVIDTNLSVFHNIRLEEFTPNHVYFSVNNNFSYNGYLSYTDAYNPHWKAFLDDKRVPILLANDGFKAVLVPPGMHKVKFMYGGITDWIVSYFLITICIFSSLVLISLIVYHLIPIQIMRKS